MCALVHFRLLGFTRKSVSMLRVVFPLRRVFEVKIFLSEMLVSGVSDRTPPLPWAAMVGTAQLSLYASSGRLFDKKNVWLSSSLTGLQ